MKALRTWLEQLGVLAPKKRRTFMSQNPIYDGLAIGDWSYGRPNVPRGDDGTTLRVGRFCSFASGVTILTGCNHRVDWVSTYPFQILGDSREALPYPSRSHGDVVIGHDVWVGVDALILSGVTIGNGAVIGARAVVTHDIPPYGIAAGVPAKVLRYRFPQATIDALQAIAWWDWPIDKIRAAAPQLMSGDLDGFIARHDPRPRPS